LNTFSNKKRRRFVSKWTEPRKNDVEFRDFLMRGPAAI
jgi:hypothetical protein